MSLHLKIARLVAGSLLALLVAGCSGINATKSVSPATFLLPGLMQADPPAAHPDSTLPASVSETEPVKS